MKATHRCLAVFNDVLTRIICSRACQDLSELGDVVDKQQLKDTKTFYHSVGLYVTSIYMLLKIPGMSCTIPTVYTMFQSKHLRLRSTSTFVSF